MAFNHGLVCAIYVGCGVAAFFFSADFSILFPEDDGLVRSIAAPVLVATFAHRLIEICLKLRLCCIKMAAKA